MPRYRFRLHGPSDAKLRDASGNMAVTGEPVEPPQYKVVNVPNDVGAQDIITAMEQEGWAYGETLPDEVA